MDPTGKLLYAALLTIYVSFITKIIWDHYKSGRLEKGVYLTIQDFKEHKEKCCTKDDYLTTQAFERHKEQCCILTLKKDFNVCQQDSCTVQSNHANRLDVIEEKIRDNQDTFKALNDKMDVKFDSWSEKFDKLIHCVGEIQGTLKYALDRERKDGGY